MAVTWGSGSGSSNPHYVGIDYSINSARTQITWAFYVRATYAVSDNQELVLTGSLSGTYPYRKEGPAQQHIVTRTQSVSPGQKVTVGARAQGIYNGGAPSHSRTVTVPAVAPGQVPRPSVGSIGSSTATASWNAPSSNGGSPILDYQLQLDDNSSFSSPSTVSGITSRSRAMTGMTPGQTWWVRVRARNAVNYGPWSPSKSFVTDALPPLAPGSPAASLDGAQPRLSWAAATTRGAAVTGYEVQRAYNSAFTDGVASNTVAASARAYTFTGTLTPGRDVWMRVRAQSSAGPGAWSTARAVTLPGGTWVKVGGTWRRVLRTWIKVGGTWRPVARTWTKVNGTWRG